MLLLALLQFSPADLSPPATLPPAAHQEPTGYTNTPPSPDGQWSIHDRNRPAPPFLEPPAGMFLAAPDDAEVLFNGTGLTGWTKGDGKTDATWKIGEGWMEVNGSGSIQTRAAMGSGHYHVEWATPKVVKGKSQGVGNSGVFLMSQFEIQVLDSYSSRTYADGQAGAMYGQFPPDANVCRAPGEWQSFDIFFEAPKWKDKKLISKAKVTVYHNGVRIHQNREYRGPSSHGSAKGYDQGKVEGPLRLQDHGNPVRFRNIWFRPDAKDTYPEARSSEKKFKTPEGFQTNLWASEPSLANPVVFYPGTDGRVYVAESYRQEYFGVPDNRSSPEFLPDDLRSQTVEDRAKMYLKHHPEYAQSWTWKQERITWLKDTDGDGHADVSRVFADGFNALLDGTGAGILVRGNQAWYTCIPNLWILEDTNGDGEVEKRESLHHGYGVRVALRGHDSHGLIMGPDGKLYFSIGDRGYNVTNQEGEVLADPGRGAVFRCNLDGSELEIFARGLRNPQELCFDDFGNLWTGDNNCDAGDLARLVYVVEGGDCGWRMNFQYIPDRGAWMPESWWKPPFEGQAAFVNAPIANVAAGPSGFAAYPGFGLSDEYRNSLFLADFRGGADYSGVLRLQTESEGAGFKLKTNDEFWWGILATDVDFLPDGRLMVSDWVESWTGVSKGRLWTGDFGADPTAGAKNAALLNSDFPAKSKTELAELLGHTDRRIRLEAQYALVDKQSHLEFRQAAAGKNPVSDPYLARMQRIHGIWGLAQLGVDFKILPLLKDRDSEIRAQVAKVLGNPDNQWAEKPLEGLLQDPSPRVQYFAAMSLGKLGPGSATPLIVLLEKNADEDRWIRHAASFALSKRATSRGLASLQSHPSKSVRMGSILALRHQNSPLLKSFLNDPNSLVAAEAARAIYDTDITAALPALAEGMRRFQNSTRLALGPKKLDPAHIRRAIHAANRVGGTKEAEWLLDYVEFGNSTTPYRLEAIEVLRNWASPKEFDPVMNESRQYPQRPGGFFAERLAPFLITEELNAVARGRKVFFENPSAGCLRCHDMEGKRGEDVPEVGPDLTFVGERLNQEQLRKSILEPSAEISKGFEIKDADGNPSKLSAMPVIYDAVLKDTEVNDLVAYLDSRRKPERLLVFVNSFGFEHSVAKPGEHGLSLVETTFQRWAKEDPRLEVIVDRDPARFAKADGLKNIDAVFFYTTGEIPIGEDGKKNLLEFVRRGGAFIGSHCASDTFYQWADYGKMLGGYFNGHPWHEEVTLKIENHRHPATQHLEKNWVIKDEIYQFKNWDRQGLKVLVSVDTDSVDMTRKSINRKDADFGITWTRKEGKGRVFYTALGHRPDVWASKTFQHHLLGGVFWATRRAD